MKSKEFWSRWFKNHDGEIAYIKASDDAGQIVDVINAFFDREEAPKPMSSPREMFTFRTP